MTLAVWFRRARRAGPWVIWLMSYT